MHNRTTQMMCNIRYNMEKTTWIVVRLLCIHSRPSHTTAQRQVLGAGPLSAAALLGSCGCTMDLYGGVQ